MYTLNTNVINILVRVPARTDDTVNFNNLNKKYKKKKIKIAAWYVYNVDHFIAEMFSSLITDELLAKNVAQKISNDR